MIEVGDHVVKNNGGYHFEGTVVARYTTLRGETRYVVEHEWGWQMIFSPQQLEEK